MFELYYILYQFVAKEGDTVKLVRIPVEDAGKLLKMQVEAFRDLYQRYQDTETSPATENMNTVLSRLQQPFTYYYYIQENGRNVGAVRVVDKGEQGTPKRISPIFILPAYRNQGMAQKAILAVEELHGKSNWELDTIWQEKANCYLYEKMGYYQTGKRKIVNDKMTLVFYRKD